MDRGLPFSALLRRTMRLAVGQVVTRLLISWTAETFSGEHAEALNRTVHCIRHDPGTVGIAHR